MTHQQQLQEIINEHKDLEHLHCVYVLYYSVDGELDRAIVVSGKTFYRSLTIILDDLSQFLKSQFAARKKENIYTDFYKYIYENAEGTFWVDICYAGDRPYEVLKTAYIYLVGTLQGAQILNRNKMPQIPKSTQRHTQRGWINRGHYLNFRIWQKKYDKGKVFH